MKQRLRLILFSFTAIILLASTISTVFPKAALAALPASTLSSIQSKEAAACKALTSQTSGGVEYDNCLAGYSGELKYADSQGSSLTSNCNTGTDANNSCATGWGYAAYLVKAAGYGSSESSVCQSSNSVNGTANTNACQAGWSAAQSSSQNGGSSGSGTTNNNSALRAQTVNQWCNDPAFNPPQVNCAQSTTAACKSYESKFNPKSTDNPYTACVLGFAFGYNGSSDSACTNGTFSGNNIKICQGQVTQGQQATGAKQNSGSQAPQCTDSGFALSWIFCQVINGLASAADGVYDDIVQPLLQTTPIDITNSSNDPTHTYAIWSNFRIYGDIFLALALLVIVFGESIGGGLIDAYSVKKVLPRLLIAAILINLSIYIVALAVDVTNVLGNGVEALIEAPFKTAACSAQTNLGTGASCFTIQINASTGGLGLAALVGGFAWGVATLGPLLEFLLVFFLIPAFLTMLAIMATVLLRRGLILFLVLISPIAFALYCLPNTEKYFRQWWDLLIKTLLVYPLIAAIFAIANVLSVTIDKTSTGVAKTFADFLAIVALFVPLFLIPFSFRIAGGLLGRFHEFATNARQRTHQGIIGSQQDPDSWRNKARSKLRQRHVERGLTGRALATNVIPPTNVFRRGTPERPSGMAEWGRNREARREADRIRVGQQYAEADAVFQANKGNDQYLLALANPGLVQRRRNQAPPAQQAAWDQAIAAARITHKSPAVRLQAANTLSSTGFQFSTGQAGYNELAETMADITGADLVPDEQGNVSHAIGSNAGTYANAMNFAQYSARQGGRFDLGGINNGTGYNYRSGISKASGYTAGQGKPKTYAAGAADYLGASLHGNELENTANEATLAEEVRTQALSSDPNAVQDIADWHSKLLDAQQGATGANQAEINKQLRAIEAVNHGTTPGNERDLNTLAGLAARLEANRRQRRSTLDPNLREE